MSSDAIDIKNEDIQNLLENCMRNCYKAKDNSEKNERIMTNCVQLFKKDYKCSIISNENGELCSHYPAKLILLEYSITDQDEDKNNVESLYDVSALKELFNKARFARCRARFALPVILFEGKHICRSATISGGAEIYGRSGFDFFMNGGGSIPDGEAPLANNANCETSDSSLPNSVGSSEWQLFNRIRGQDIKLLKTFSVGIICDLMVEKKKVKFGLNVTSSEKVDKEHRYADFSLLSVPYPGCEFFRLWRDGGYRAEAMTFDWNQSYVDAKLDIPLPPSPPKDIDWFSYKNWDLTRLTQNYLKLLLNYIVQGNCGMLVHCISGWDRTPLFISLIRLTLWADGVIHTSLSPTEMLYLTIAYDWFLFGHDLPDRVSKGEEIFFFCFYFLKYLVSDDYSVAKRLKRAARRKDSECHIDGVLLDSSRRGSNASINSTSSLNSTKSSLDNVPILFTSGSLEEDSFVSNGPSVSNGNNNPQLRAPEHMCRGSLFSHSTSPMAVPTVVHHNKNVTELRSYGSWQIISGSGSFRGSSSSHSSHCSTQDQPSIQCACCHEIQEVEEETVRKQKLDSVRQTFMTLYTSQLGSPSSLEPSSISGLLENFAEKVGFKSGKNTQV